MNALFSTVGAFSGSSPKPSLSNALNGLLVAIGYCGSFPDSSCGCIARTLRAGAEAGHRPEIPLLAGRAAVEAHPEKVLVQPLNHRWRCALHNIQRDGRSRRAVPRLVAPFLEKVGIPLREPHDFRQRIPGEFHPDRLQRGRATGGAEFIAAHRQKRRQCNASTGPRPGGRGITVTNLTGTASINMLQRGRAPGGAEFRTMNKPHDTDLWQLQRGRAPGGAELSESAGGRGPSEDASTGPRPGGRGICRGCLLSASWLFLLQRGRAPGGAELTAGGVTSITGTALQRGRAPGGAELERCANG